VLPIVTLIFARIHFCWFKIFFRGLPKNIHNELEKFPLVHIYIGEYFLSEVGREYDDFLLLPHRFFILGLRVACSPALSSCCWSCLQHRKFCLLCCWFPSNFIAACVFLLAHCHRSIPMKFYPYSQCMCRRLPLHVAKKTSACSKQLLELYYWKMCAGLASEMCRENALGGSHFTLP
jgi:hypothetical protein